jgi:hypothetical protein
MTKRRNFSVDVGGSLNIARRTSLLVLILLRRISLAAVAWPRPNFSGGFLIGQAQLEILLVSSRPCRPASSDLIWSSP